MCSNKSSHLVKEVPEVAYRELMVIDRKTCDAGCLFESNLGICEMLDRFAWLWGCGKLLA